MTLSKIQKDWLSAVLGTIFFLPALAVLLAALLFVRPSETELLVFGGGGVILLGVYIYRREAKKLRQQGEK